MVGDVRNVRGDDDQVCAGVVSGLDQNAVDVDGRVGARIAAPLGFDAVFGSLGCRELLDFLLELGRVVGDAVGVSAVTPT